MSLKPFLPLLLLTLALAACAPVELPTDAPQAEPTGVLGEPQPAHIDNVDVEIGVGSPIPVHAVIGGTLPSPCDQIAQVLQSRSGTDLAITILTTTSTDETCLQDPIPFTMRVPLNMIGFGPGDYTVDVNGMRAPLAWTYGDPAPVVMATEGAPGMKEAHIDNVDVVVGLGSPLPVHLVVSGTLPNSCARLGEVALRRIGTTGQGFDLDLVSHTYVGDNCIADAMPFQLEFPLNVVGLPDGPARVTINGVTTTVDWQTPQ